MFTRARIKLTIWYLLIIMLISIMFSFSIYRILTGELERGFHRITQRYLQEYGPMPLPGNPVFELSYLQASEDRIRWTLIYINLIIFGVSGVGGYILAGITLKPIADMILEQNRFVADASHELKTPLTVLKSEIEVYLRGKNHTTKDADKLLQSNLEEVNNLQTLSDTLIALAQYPTISKTYSFTSVMLSDVLNESIKKIQKSAHQKAIHIQTRVGKYMVLGHYDSLVKLFGALLDNAVKYSPEKSTIDITAQKTDGSVVIEVKDTGMGIEEKDIPHIFDRFYRADTSRTKQDIPGYGLGLSIAKKIVEEHKGSIKVTSKVSKGSVFAVTLPIA